MFYCVSYQDDDFSFYEVEDKITDKFGHKLMMEFISFIDNDNNTIFAIKNLSDIILNDNIFYKHIILRDDILKCFGRKLFIIDNPIPYTYPPLFSSKSIRKQKKSSITQLSSKFYLFKDIFLEYLNEDIISELKKLAYPNDSSPEYIKNYSPGYQLLLKEFNLC